MKSIVLTTKDLPVSDAPKITFRPDPKSTTAGGFRGLVQAR
jgi:hypothetical protein